MLAIVGAVALLLGTAAPTLASARTESPVLTIHIGNGLVQPLADIAGNGTDMWVLGDNGATANEFSEATGRPLQTISGLAAHEGIAVDASDVWTVDYDGDLAQEVSPATGTIAASVPLNLTGSGCCDDPVPIGTIFDDGTDVWVVNSQYDDLAEVDDASQQLVQTVNGGSDSLHFTGEVAAADGDVWLTDTAGIDELAASSGALIRQIPIYDPNGVLVADGSVWVTSRPQSGGDGIANTLTQLSEASGQVVRKIAMPYPAVGGEPEMAANAADLFVASARGVSKYSLASGQLVADMTGPTYGITAAQGVVASASRVWVLDGADGSLSELSAITDAPIHPSWLPPLTPVVGLAVVGSHAWTADSSGCFGAPPPSGTVAEFDALTGKELEFLDADRADVGCPVGIVTAGETVWVLGWGNNDEANTLTSFSNLTGKRETQVDVPTENYGLPPRMVASGGNVWVLRSAWGLVEFSGATGKRLHSYGLKPLGAHRWFQAIAAEGPDVWIASDTSLAELSGKTGAILHVYTGASHGFDGVGGSVSMVAGDGRVWVDQEGADSNSEWLSEYDASNGAKLGTIEPGALGQTELFIDLLAGDHLVISALGASGPSVLELDAATGALQQTLLSGPAQPLAAAGNHLWTTQTGVLQVFSL